MYNLETPALKATIFTEQFEKNLSWARHVVSDYKLSENFGEILLQLILRGFVVVPEETATQLQGVLWAERLKFSLQPATA